jgi:ADP-heptose:LPS heptosyltransferase
MTASGQKERTLAVLVDREGLGDALLKLPFLRAVKHAFPDRPLWWIATHETAMARELRPWVEGLIDHAIENAGLTVPARAVVARLRALPAFDLVFDSRTRFATVLLACALTSHRGFYACLPGYMLCSRRPPGRFVRPRHVGLRMLSLVTAASGRPAETAGTFDLSAAVIDLAASRLPAGETYVGLATGSREARKNWPLERFIALAGVLKRARLTPVFLIGPQERDVLAQLRASVPWALFPEAEPVVSALKLRPLELAMAIGQRLSVAVANDSGIGHLLGALGTPLVSLFGPSDPRRWRPFATQGVVLRAQSYGAASMDAIPVEPVLAAVNSLIVLQNP